jgi:hypothetical protein
MILDFFSFCFDTGSCYVVQASLELSILLSQPPEWWDYRCATPYPKDVVTNLGGETFKKWGLIGGSDITRVCR